MEKSQAYPPHEHTYVLANTVYVREVHHGYAHYGRFRSFFCTGCLAEAERATKVYNQREVPSWFVMQGCETKIGDEACTCGSRGGER